MRRFLFPGFLGFALAFLLPIPLAEGGAPDWCLISNIPCPGRAGTPLTEDNLFKLIQVKFIQTLRYAVVAIAFGMFVYYAFALLFLSDDENAVTQMKGSFMQAIVGCAIISIAALIADALAPNISTLTNPLSGPVTAKVTTGLQKVIEYIKYLVGIVVSFHVTYQGIRLIALQGKEEEVTKQKAKFFHGLIGVAVVLLASSIVKWATPQTELGGDPSILSTEIGGIANFLITLFGLLAVIAFIASAAVLLLSIDEGGKEKGKKGMIGSVVVLVIVFSSWAIIKYVLDFRL